MLRLDLLRDLRAGTPKKPGKPERPGSGPARRAMLAGLILLLVGAGLLFLSRPQWPRWTELPAVPGFLGGNAKAKADSLRRVEALRDAASRSIDASLGLSTAWLDQFETLPLENDAWTMSVSSFTPPDRFLLRGTARSGEALSAIQEALILFPGANLKVSSADKLEDAADAYAFEFSGTVRLEPDSAFAGDRTLPAAGIAGALDSLMASAATHGITLAPPATGSATQGGGLELRTFRATGSCDSSGISGIRSFFVHQRLTRAPFGIRRMVLEKRGERMAVFLDIMTFVH